MLVYDFNCVFTTLITQNTDDGPLSPAQISVLQAVANEDLPKGAVVRISSLFAGG